MMYAYRNAGKLDEETRKKIKDVVEKCEICKRQSKSKTKPAVAIPKAIEFNTISQKFWLRVKELFKEFG